MIKAVRGTRDLLPPDTALWNFVEAAVRDVFRAYNFQEIRTPIFEETALFARGVGEDTDIVSKEMYTWDDGERFQKALLVSKWNLANADRFGSIVESTSSDSLSDMECEDNDGNWEIVNFGARPTPDAIKRLASAVSKEREFLAQLSSSKKVTGRFVFPSPFPTESEQRTPEGLLLEAVHGNFSKSSQSLTLRPENTAGVVRAYIEHKLWDRGLNKLYYIGPQFRRERPQKGRYRQFYQIGAEVIGPASAGSESPARDAEVLEMLATLLDRIGISDWNLELNSVGTPADRVQFNEALRKALEPVVGNMCADCQRRAVTNPLRVFDCKVPEDQPVIETLPRITQFLGEDSRKHFEAVQAILTKVGVPFKLNERLVRGLDYYTRTAFEFTHGALGAQNAILGGGRYDGLSEALGGPAAPGIGFAIGEDRLVMSLQEKASADSVLRKPDVYIAPMATMNAEAAALARELRRSDLVVELGDENFRLKKSFEAATKANATYILIVGENEVKADAFSLKNLASGEQVSVARSELATKIRTQ